MDTTDRLLLMHLQTGLKLESKPYETLAKKIGCDVVEVFLRTQHFKEEKNFQKIAGVFDLKKLGYQNALVAMQMSPTQMDHALHFLGEHPAISFLFDVRNEYNLWFNLSMPKGFALNEHVNYLHKASHADKTVILPVIEAFRMQLGSKRFSQQAPETESLNFSEEELKVIRSLQNDLPLTDEPFKKLASAVDLTEDKFLAIAHDLSRLKVLKRLGAVSAPKPMRQKGKALLMWNIPEEREAGIASEIILTEAVLNCTKRPASEKFPYTVYAMIKSSGIDEAVEVAGEIEARIGRWPRQVLAIENEYKRVPIEYFSEELDAWTKRAKSLQSS